MEKSNQETRKMLKDSVNNKLKKFSTTLINSIQEMITKQIEESNKNMMAAIQTAMKASTITHQHPFK